MRFPLARLGIIVTLVLAWSVPYAVVAHTYPIPTFFAEFVSFALFLLVALAVGIAVTRGDAARNAREDARSPRSAFVPLAFGLWIVLQQWVVPTHQPTLNLLGAGYLLAAALVLHAGYWLAVMRCARHAMGVIAWALVASGIFAVFCQVVQLFGAEVRFTPFIVAYNVTIERRPFGNMAQANHLATYVSFALAASVYLWQTRRLRGYLWLPLALWLMLGGALTVSRTPWLQTFVIALGAWVSAYSIAREQAPWSPTSARVFGTRWRHIARLRAPLAVLALFVIVNLVVRWANIAFGLHLAVSAAERFHDVGQISPRLALWRYGWEMFRAHPWLGVGWGEFPRYQYRFVDTLGHVEIANNAHDILIDLLAKTGLLGAVIVVLGLVLWFWRALNGGCRPWRIFCLVLLAVLCCHALVEYPQQYMFFLLPAAFLVGVLETESMVRVGARVTRWLYGLCLVLGIGALYPVLSDYQRAELLYYGKHPEHDYRAQPSSLFSAWGEYGLATLLPLNRNDITQKLSMHRQAIALLPGETVVRRYAVLLALDGQDTAALDAVARLRIFAESLNDWPQQLHALIKLCDEHSPELDAFKAELIRRYGGSTATAAAADDSDDDDDDTD